jgi:ubiquinol oxidase
MNRVPIAHRETQSLSDRVALGVVRFLRSAMDLATGYHHPDDSKTEGTKATANSTMTEAKWLVRFVFLESVAGVPGMVGGMIRHLHSLRKMKRDNGWYDMRSTCHGNRC